MKSKTEILKYNLINNKAYLSKEDLTNNKNSRIFLSYSMKYTEFFHGLKGNYGYSLDFVFLKFEKDTSEKQIKTAIYKKSQFSNIVVFELEDNILIEKWVRFNKKWFDYNQETNRFFCEYIIIN